MSEKEAQDIIDCALAKIRAGGWAVVADGTVHGNGIWVHRLRVWEFGEDPKGTAAIDTRGNLA